VGWEAVRIGRRVAGHIGERRVVATRKGAATHTGRHQEAAGFEIRRVVPRSHNQRKAQDPGAR
jgi:hypothetical protein